MSFLLHTDAVLRYLRNDPAVGRRVQQYGGQLHCSVLTLTAVELLLSHWRTPLYLTQGYFAFLPRVMVLNVDVRIAQEAARVGTAFRVQGKRLLPAVDLLIAATALMHGLTLVTRSPGPFAAVAGLNVVDWTLP